MQITCPCLQNFINTVEIHWNDTKQYAKHQKLYSYTTDSKVQALKISLCFGIFECIQLTGDTFSGRGSWQISGCCKLWQGTVAFCFHEAPNFMDVSYMRRASVTKTFVLELKWLIICPLFPSLGQEGYIRVKGLSIESNQHELRGITKN